MVFARFGNEFYRSRAGIDQVEIVPGRSRLPVIPVITFKSWLNLHMVLMVLL